MKLKERMETDGAFLFRWRSFVPYVLVPLCVFALFESARIDQTIGEGLDNYWMYIGLSISLFGLGIRWLTVGCVPAGTSGRNTRSQRADTLNTSGMYSIVRNPLYFGNFLALFGMVLAIKVWWFLVIAVLAYWLYIERIIVTEEAYLSSKFGEAFTAYAAHTPAFLPRPSNWRKPELPFSIRTVLRREYNGVMTVIASFVVLEFSMDVLIEREYFALWLQSDFFWPILFAFVATLFITLRYLKKQTTLLDVPGRR